MTTTTPRRLGTATLRMAVDQDFPYRSQLVTFILITADEVTQAKTIAEKRAACATAQADESVTLLAAWPGEYSQDIFLVDAVVAAEGLAAPKRSTSNA